MRKHERRRKAQMCLKPRRKLLKHRLVRADAYLGHAGLLLGTIQNFPPHCSRFNCQYTCRAYEVIVFDLVTCKNQIISLINEALARMLHFVIYILFVPPASFRCSSFASLPVTCFSFKAAAPVSLPHRHAI